jgi:hypothetical protein
MKLYFKEVFFLIYTLLLGIVATAQPGTEHAEHTQGTLQRNQQVLKFIRSFKYLPDAKATSLANTTNKIMDVVCESSQLNPPVGFDAEVNMAASDLEFKATKPQLKVFCYLRYLMKDNSGQVKKSMDGADINLWINRFDAFNQAGNYWQACDQLKLPLFFEEIPLSDSTSDYISFKHAGYDIRVILANNKPFFVPLTRKEFVQFLIARGAQALKEDQEALETSRKSKTTIAKLMATQTESDKAYSASAVRSIDDGIGQWQKNIQQQEKENRACQSLLNSMAPQEAAAPARMDYNKKSNSQRFGGLDQLVPVGRREGVLLTKVNPDYYNKSPLAPVAQMIMVYYGWPTVGFAQDPDYLQQKTMDIFNQLDYHALKESMK